MKISFFAYGKNYFRINGFALSLAALKHRLVITRKRLIFDKWNYFSHDARRSWEHGIENLNLKFQSRWRIHQQAAQARCINYREFRYCVILFYVLFHITNHLKNLYVQFNIIYAPSLDRLWYNQSCINLSSLIRDVAFFISSTRHTTYSSTHLLPYCCFLLLVVEQLCSGWIVPTVARKPYFMEVCFDIYIKYSDPDKQAIF